MQFTDVMIDLETLGNTPGSVMTQIGLCAFNLSPRDEEANGFKHCNIYVDPANAMKWGLTCDWSTIRWWLQQDQAARDGMVAQPGIPLESALLRTGDFIQEYAGIDKVRVWGNGCGFDITFLEIAYQKVSLPCPWNFRNVRDLRTLADIETPLPVDKSKAGVAHRAEDDALAQARWAQTLYRAIVQR